MVVIALAAVAALGWGASDFFGGDSSGRGLPVFTVVAVSELLGTVALIPVLAVRGLPDLDGPAAALAVIAGIAVTAELSLIYSALGRGDSFATAPVSALGTAIAMAAGLMTGDPLSPVIAAGLACAVLGGGISTWASPASDGGGIIRTAATCVGASASVAVMLACLHAAGRSDPYWATALEHAGTAVSAGLIAAVQAWRRPHGGAFGPSDPAGLSGRLGLRRFGSSRQLAYLVVMAIAGAGGDLAYAAASRQGALSVVAAVSSLYPLSTIALGRLLRGTRARLPQLTGAVVALLGAGLLSPAVR